MVNSSLIWVLEKYHEAWVCLAAHGKYKLNWDPICESVLAHVAIIEGQCHSTCSPHACVAFSSRSTFCRLKSLRWRHSSCPVLQHHRPRSLCQEERQLLKRDTRGTKARAVRWLAVIRTSLWSSPLWKTAKRYRPRTVSPPLSRTVVLSTELMVRGLASKVRGQNVKMGEAWPRVAALRDPSVPFLPDWWGEPGAYLRACSS